MTQTTPPSPRIRTGLASRRRQFEVRDGLGRLQDLVDKLQNRADHLRQMASEITEAEYCERRRVADVLHGDVQQSLVVAGRTLESLASIPDETVRRIAQNTQALIAQAIETCRLLNHELSSPVLRYSGLVAAAEELKEEMETKHGLRVHLRAPRGGFVADEPLRVFLYQSLREMLLNTVKHSGVKEATVDISDQRKGIRIAVSDRGRGFDPSKSRIEGGHEGGFGLFGVKERVALFGGRLQVTSAPGKGCRVVLSAPNKRTHRSEARQVPRRLHVESEASPTERVRVVVADDHDMMRSGIVAMLSSEPDIEVVAEARNGREAVESARKFQPEVVVMDVSMPVMDGVKATRMVHQEFPRIQVIGLSAFQTSAIARSMLDAGACAHLLKDQASAALLDTIRNCRKNAARPSG